MKLVNKVKSQAFNSLSKKISQKASILQFLPQDLTELKSEKYIVFDSQKLKTSYIIDIVNSLILKYYFKKENRFAINSLVLKDKYGHLYNYYIKWLVEKGHLKMINNYRKGHSSRIYCLNEKILMQKILRFSNTDSILLKKYKKKIFDTIDFSESANSLIDIDIKEKLIEDLFSVKIDLQRSIFFLDSLKNVDLDMYNRNMYSVDCINHKHIFYHFDSFGRMHTNFTILKSFIRKNCLLIDNLETCEIDINNSQPLFLTKLIQDSKSKWIKTEEFDKFKELTISGKYYEFMMQQLKITDKKEIKRLTYKVLFGRNASNSRADKYFKQIFPSIHNFIVLYKKEFGDYKVLSHELQKMESKLIFNTIIKKIMILYPHIKIITVHDSIIVAQKFRDEVETIFNSELLNEFSF